MNYEALVPQRMDAFAFIICLGVVQGFVFSYFLLKGKNRLDPRNTYLGLFLLCYSLVLLEVFLCYTGLIVHTLWLVDYSESTNFLSAPLLYFMVLGFLGKAFKPKHRWHYLPFGLYLLYMVFFFVQPEAYKFNAYIDAYYPEMPKIEAHEVVDPDPLDIKQYINQISVIYSAVYITMSLLAVLRSMRDDQLKVFKGAQPEIAWARNLVLLALVSYFFWVVKSFTGIRDVQDHIGASLNTIVIYFVGFRMIQSGAFVKKNGEKYTRSSLSDDRKEQIIDKLEKLKEEAYFLNSDLSMADLARSIGATPHHLSQVLNEALQTSYGDYINQLRIGHAQELLRDQPNIKIEEIAAMSGFNSKSTFNTAFKRITGKTPSEYRNSMI